MIITITAKKATILRTKMTQFPLKHEPSSSHHQCAGEAAPGGDAERPGAPEEGPAAGGGDGREERLMEEKLFRGD